MRTRTPRRPSLQCWEQAMWAVFWRGGLRPGRLSPERGKRLRRATSIEGVDAGGSGERCAEGGGDGLEGVGGGAGGIGGGGVFPEAAAGGVDALALDELVEEGFAPGDGSVGGEEDDVVSDEIEGEGEAGEGEVEVAAAVRGRVACEQGEEIGDVFGGAGRGAGGPSGGVGEILRGRMEAGPWVFRIWSTA